MVTKAKAKAAPEKEVAKPVTDPRHLSYIKAVREYAEDHYADEDMAWDEIQEAWSDWDIVAATAFCRSPEGAVRKVAGIVKDRADYRNEIISA